MYHGARQVLHLYINNDFIINSELKASEEMPKEGKYVVFLLPVRNLAAALCTV